MSKLAEEFLKIQTYEEFDKRREEFRGLNIREPGVFEHMGDISPYIGDEIKDGIIHELFREA